MNTLMDLDDITFAENIRNEKGIVILNFIADWCGPCKIMSPILETIAKEEKVKIFKVNVDKSPDLAIKFGITSVPVTMFMNSGSKICQINGLKSKEELKEKLYELR
ncbi:thioredoxin family protein [Fusobacterium necrogenes]|uniref:thioredoxin family protein n=1 Tax=Fusobacterium necrogenes TaxID=858 RepID=UPI00255C6628|nr:thioredoxin domain-containing protein [Fusobacterium necrogenes]